MFKIIATNLKGENGVLEENIIFCLKHNLRHNKWNKKVFNEI